MACTEYNTLIRAIGVSECLPVPLEKNSSSSKAPIPPIFYIYTGNLLSQKGSCLAPIIPLAGYGVNMSSELTGRYLKVVPMRLIPKQGVQIQPGNSFVVFTVPLAGQCQILHMS